MAETIIFHVDVNSAFLSWEASYRKDILGEEIDLRDIPSAIGGDKEKRKGIILAKSTPAKAYQIQTGEPIVAALKKCPDLFIAKPNFELYVRCSKAFMSILREYTPIVEQYSIDEAFMDMTGMEGLYGDPIQLAYIIKDRIYNELGFTVNIGISNNKLLAKMAGDFEKPNKVHTLFPHEIEKKMWPLPIRDLFFVGRSTEKTLKLLGIKTIGDLAHADIKLIKLHLKKHGETIYRYAHGIDQSRVEEVAAPNKGYGNSMTIPYDVDTVEGAKRVLLSLTETVAARLRADHMEASCISVSLVDYEFNHCSKQMTLKTNTCHTQEIYECACEIFEQLWDHCTPIRQLGVHTTKLEDSNIHQMTLFEQESLYRNSIHQTQRDKGESSGITNSDCVRGIKLNIEEQSVGSKTQDTTRLNRDKLIQGRTIQNRDKPTQNKSQEETYLKYQKNRKLEKLDFAIDAIRNKFGDDSIKRATFLEGKIDHMAGGLSKEKKNGITKGL